MPRELLKFRPGDVGIKIQKNGKLEIAGVTPDLPMIDREGNVNPALLFAAAWARKDPKVFELLIQNFKASVGDGMFGPEAQTDYKNALQIKQQKEDDEVREYQSTEPSLGNEFETHYDKPSDDTSASASGAVTFEQPVPGNTSWPGEKEKEEVGTPSPLTTEEHLSRRNS